MKKKKKNYEHVKFENNRILLVLIIIIRNFIFEKNSNIFELRGYDIFCITTTQKITTTQMTYSLPSGKISAYFKGIFERLLAILRNNSPA